MVGHRLRFLYLLCATALLSVACSGGGQDRSIPDHLREEGRAYGATDPITVKMPKNWHTTDRLFGQGGINLVLKREHFADGPAPIIEVWIHRRGVERAIIEEKLEESLDFIDSRNEADPENVDIFNFGRTRYRGRTAGWADITYKLGEDYYRNYYLLTVINKQLIVFSYRAAPEAYDRFKPMFDEVTRSFQMWG